MQAIRVLERSNDRDEMIKVSRRLISTILGFLKNPDIKRVLGLGTLEEAALQNGKLLPSTHNKVKTLIEQVLEMHRGQ